MTVPQSPAFVTTELDRLLPQYHFHERHHRVAAAPPDRVQDAFAEVTLSEMPLVPALFALRSLPARLSGRGSLHRKTNKPLLAQMLASGFVPLAEAPGREVVFGLVAQMWKRNGQTIAIHSTDEFRTFNRPGFVKVATNFVFTEHQNGTRVTTETRVLATDQESRNGFGRYWRVIRPGSGLIRRSWLWAIARRAEASYSDAP